MEWTNRLSNLGGGLGAIIAWILNIQLSHVFEIALYAFIGSAIGEAVKELVVRIKKNKKD